MKRKDYIKPFVEFSLIEVDSDLLAGSPHNSGDNVLPGESNPMKDDVNGNIKDQPEVIPEPAAKGTSFWDDMFEEGE